MRIVSEIFVATGCILIPLPVSGRYLAKSLSYICRVKEEMDILHILKEGRPPGFATSSFGIAF